MSELEERIAKLSSEKRRLLERRLKEQGLDLPAAEPAPTAKIWDPIVPLQPYGDRPPFFFVHGASGDVVDHLHLARTLEKNQPSYGLRAIGLHGEDPPDETVEAMAIRYIKAIRAMEPNGPYHIGGYCYSNMVAFEMAQQLKNAGAQVGLVALIEGIMPWGLQKRRSFFSPERLNAIWRNIPAWAKYYSEFDRAKIRRGVSKFLPNPLRGQKTAAEGTLSPRSMHGLADNDAALLSERRLRFLEFHLNVYRAYRPQPFGGRVTLFYAKVQSISKTIFGPYDPTLGWGSLATDVNVIEVDGMHDNVHLPPHVKSLAKALQGCLDRY